MICDKCKTLEFLKKLVKVLEDANAADLSTRSRSHYNKIQERYMTRNQIISPLLNQIRKMECERKIQNQKGKLLRKIDKHEK